MKKYTVYILILFFIFNLSINAMDDKKEKEKAGVSQEAKIQALHLNSLGLFKGTSSGFDLEGKPTRGQALVMLIRLLGKEDPAQTYKGESYFYDVSEEWLIPYVNYAYEMGLAKGVGNSLFHPNEPITKEAYITYVLRALGYNEGKDGDFYWLDSYEFSKNKAILPKEMDLDLLEGEFLRADMVRISYEALKAKYKNSQISLADNLIDKGVLDLDKAILANVTGRMPIKKDPIEEEKPRETTSIEVEDPKDKNLSKAEPVTKDYPLLGEASATKEQVKKWASSKGMSLEGLELVNIYYDICKEKGLNPVIQYAQMCHETGFLYKVNSYAGLDVSYHNPCGLKVTQGGDGMIAQSHKKFDNWFQGIDAHTDHSALYAGAQGYPKQETETSDPRHFPYLFGQARYLEDLSERWAPSPTYHEKILKMVKEIEATK